MSECPNCKAGTLVAPSACILCGYSERPDLIEQALQACLAESKLHAGRMISASKSGYHQSHPGHTVFYNACIFIRVKVRLFRHEYRQVWWGDIDLTLEGDGVQRVADLRGETLYVTSEHFGRWEGVDSKKIAAELKKPHPRVYVYEPSNA